MALYAAGKLAKAECDRCGQMYLLNKLHKLTINQALTNLKVCDSCWEPDHEQNGTRFVIDAEALREPRPDHNRDDFRNISWGWNPVSVPIATGAVGEVTVTIE